MFSRARATARNGVSETNHERKREEKKRKKSAGGGGLKTVESCMKWNHSKVLRPHRGEKFREARWLIANLWITSPSPKRGRSGLLCSSEAFHDMTHKWDERDQSSGKWELRENREELSPPTSSGIEMDWPQCERSARSEWRTRFEFEIWAGKLLHH